MTDKPTKGASGLESLQYDAIIESTATPGQFGIVVLDSTGADISGGGGGGGAVTGGAVTVADGADVAEGATTDASVAAGAAGSISAKMRRLTTDLDAVKTSVASLDSKTTAVNTGAVTVSSSVLPTGASTSAKQDTGNTSLSSIDGKITACNTGAVTISSALPAGANAIGSVSVSNGSGGSAVNIQDGGNSITVDGTVSVAQSTASSLNAQIVGNVASAATDSGNPVKIGGIYNTTQPTLTNGQRGDAQLDSRANLSTTLGTLIHGEDESNSLMATAVKPVSGSTYAATSNADFGTVVTLRVKNGSGNLFQIDGHNNNAAARYLQLHNTTTALSGSEVPIKSYLVPSGSQIILNTLDLSGTQGGLYFSTGITWGWSTTKNTYTAATAGDHVTTCNYS